MNTTENSTFAPTTRTSRTPKWAASLGHTIALNWRESRLAHEHMHDLNR